MNVLVADTSVLFREGVKSVLAHKYSDLSFREVDCDADFKVALNTDVFDIIISDPVHVKIGRVKDYDKQKKACVISISSELSRPFILSTLQNGINARYQFARTERLSNIIITSYLQPENAVNLIITRRQKQNRHL